MKVVVVKKDKGFLWLLFKKGIRCEERNHRVAEQHSQKGGGTVLPCLRLFALLQEQKIRVSRKNGEYNDFSILAGITFAGRSYIWIRKRKRRDKLYGVPSNEGGNPGLRNDPGHLS